MTGPEGTLELSVVVPVYNERPNLEPLVLELNEVLKPETRPLEIILVDDGSDDGSADAIDRLAASHAHVCGVHFRENSGQTAAFDAGFKVARGRFVVTMDADLQNDPADIEKLLEALRDHDAAVGFRAKRADSWVRRFSSRIANGVRNRLSGDDIVDTGCSLKVFRLECLRSLKLYKGMHRFFPTLLRIEGYRVAQIPVNHRPRRAGRSKYGIGNRIFTTFADLLAVRWMKKRHLDYEVSRYER